MSSNAWWAVQRELSTITRTCSYDRAGYGWSESGPRPRTLAAAAGELKTALASGHIEAPYLVVGHSLGGAHARVFAHRFPAAVAGLVLVATGHPDVTARDPEAARREAEPPPLLFRIAPALARAGVFYVWPSRWMPQVSREYTALLRKYLPRDLAEAELSFLRRPKHLQAMLDELNAPSEDEALDRAARNFGDLPLVVLTERWVFSPHPDARELASARIENELQNEMAAFSTRGRRIDVPSGHLIPLERPAAVVSAVREVLAAAKTRASAAGSRRSTSRGRAAARPRRSFPPAGASPPPPPS
jgi:pimeloyl-ACP methyl ester carboxylesterase